MKKQLFQRAVSWLLVLCMVLPFVPAAEAASVRWKKTDQQIRVDRPDRLVQEAGPEERDPAQLVRVSIVLEEPSAIEAGYSTMGIASNPQAMDHQVRLQKAQERMEKTISARILGGRPLDVVWNMTLVGNIISAWVPYGKIDAIAGLPGVRTVAMEAQYEPCVAERVEGVEPNVYPSSAMTGTGALWNGGYTGAGTRIAIVDTGTDTDHQSFDNGAYLYALAENAAAKGMSPESYKASLDMMTQDTIAAVLPRLHASQRLPGVTAADLYHNEKLAFGFNYVDASLNIVHDYDQQGEHGSHVAGISTANRYIPGNGGYQDARESVMMQGVAPDAQLITMKVFGNGSPFDSDYMAAIEDAIMLGCDVVNLSMGTTMPGSPYTDVYSELMEMMTHTDTVVVISAGNASNWAAASTFGYLYHDDVSFDTVGAPGSYASAFTVASVDNDGMVGYSFAVNGRKISYAETLGYGNAPLAGLDYSDNKAGSVYDYIFLDGLGYAEEYAGINVAGKIVLVSRGVLNFADKANEALSRGAVAVMIYNNEPGIHYMDLTGLNISAPVVSISQEDASAIRAASEDHGTYLCGKLTVYGKAGVVQSGAAYYTMSSFSSWGIPSSLTLKPEITAPGGNIYSVWGSNAVTGGGSEQYETMSGTSMAAPQVAGMAALLAQYYMENGLAEKSGLSARHLAQSLLMSTAQPLYEENSGGNYYSLMSQGAGLARVDLAAQAESFVLVQGQADGKVKAELGDDPERTGVYSFDFTITNLTDTSAAYTLDADIFRQDVFEYQPGSGVWMLDTWTTGLDAVVSFTSANLGAGSAANHDLNGDGVTSADDADFLLEYILGNETSLCGNGDLSGDGVINSYDAHLLLAGLNGEVLTVPAGGTATVGVKLKLTPEAKAELDAKTPNGTYVQAFVYARAVADAEGDVGTTHSIPVLAFYGDWSEPSMFDRGTLLDLDYGNSNTAPYLYRVVGNYGNALAIDYGDGTAYYYGGNPLVDDDVYLPERNAFNSEDASVLTEQSFTLIRGAGDARIQIANADTGEVYFARQLGELYPAYYDPSYGGWDNTIQYAGLGWTGTNAAGRPLAEGTKVAVSLTAVPHYYRRADGTFLFDGLGAGATMTTTMTIDNTAPQILDIDVSAAAEDKLTIRARDNAYVAAMALLNAKGTKVLSIQSPNQTEPNRETALTLDISGVSGKTFLVAVFDYAGNMNAYEVELDRPEIARDYFTAIDCETMAYVSADRNGQTTFLADSDLPAAPRAAEYVDGYVFVVDANNTLYVAKDADLTVTERIGRLDPHNELQISAVNDLAYNHADGQLYIQFYSQYNYEAAPYLATVDLSDGSLERVCELPVDVNTMAIDGEGNFYSAGFGSNLLYTYTLEQVTGGTPDMTCVGEMGYYFTTQVSSMAWDHNEDRLYWAFPNTLLKINPRTAEPTLLGYHTNLLVGLYIRSGEPSGRFDPVDRVDRTEMIQTDTRVLVGSTVTLEAAVWPWNASDRTVTWTTSDASVATVDDRGNVTGRNVGSCVITATSNLDPRFSASCTVTSFALDKTLQGLVWDEMGEIWMSEFNTATIPEYTKLSEKSLGKSIASATMGQDGSIYAASLDLGTLRSELYRLDPVTFQPTLIGPSTDAYMDLAPAPGAPGNSLMAVYGGNVLIVDADTGDYYNWYYMFSNNLVAIAYVGTQPYQAMGYDSMIDWYFIIDQAGYVYLMGFMEQNGVYYYLEHDVLAPGGVYTVLDLEMETPYFGSAYFDGEMLYFGAYRESRNNVTLVAIDVAGGNKACYQIGTFGDGIWPVAGLMELGELGGDAGILSTNSRPIPIDHQAEPKGIREERTAGSLHAAAVPMSGAEAEKEQIRVTITTPAEGTNGIMTIGYDPSMLRFDGAEGLTDAFAWKLAGDGVVQLAFAEGAALPADTVIGNLKFTGLESGSTTVSVSCGEWGDDIIEFVEHMYITVDIEKPHEHSYTAAVTEPTCTEGGYTTYTCACGDSYVADPVDALGHDMGAWYTVTAPTCTVDGSECRDCARCDHQEVRVIGALGHSHTAVVTEPTCTEGGYTTYTCACGDSYVADPVDALGHDYVNGVCTRCGAEKALFTDVPEGTYYYEPVIWAVENGITTGATATTFNPNGVCMRGHVVTFLWRAMGKPEPVTTVNPFVDVAESDYFYKAVLWAYENGITTGVNADHFAPTGECNRAQVVTFLWRAMGKPDSQMEVSFTDVQPGQFYTTAVAWAVEHGITNGMGDGTFGVLKSCIRAQVVTFLYRTLT